MGKSIGQGKTRFAGLLFFRTTSPGQLAFLNNLVGVFEYQSDKQENASSKIWEWKPEASVLRIAYGAPPKFA